MRARPLPDHVLEPRRVGRGRSLDHQRDVVHGVFGGEIVAGPPVRSPHDRAAPVDVEDLRVIPRGGGKPADRALAVGRHVRGLNREPTTDGGRQLADVPARALVGIPRRRAQQDPHERAEPARLGLLQAFDDGVPEQARGWRKQPGEIDAHARTRDEIRDPAQERLAARRRLEARELAPAVRGLQEPARREGVAAGDPPELPLGARRALSERGRDPVQVWGRRRGGGRRDEHDHRRDHRDGETRPQGPPEPHRLRNIPADPALDGLSGGGGIRTRGPGYTDASFQDWCIRPLCHPSEVRRRC